MKVFKKISIKTAALLSFLILASMLQKAFAVGGTISILPGPPLNVFVTHLSPTAVELTWDASLTLPSSITAYEIYYKLKTDASYPLVPQVVRSDSLASYSETITVSANTGYDFKVFAVGMNGLKSSGTCASCETTNATCGNGIAEPGESCDGLDLNGFACTDFAYTSGALACTPACSFDFSSCSAGVASGGSGGGGGPGLDVTIPNPGTASSPEQSNSPSILVTYSGGSDVGGSGFSHVDLYYKKDSGPWLNSGLSFPNTAGSFEFFPDGNGIYYFDLKAYDRQGNSSATPLTGDGDTHTTYDASAPVFETLSIGTFSSNNQPLINYTGAVDIGLAGLEKIELWYKKGESGSWTNSGLIANQPNGSFEFSFADFLNATYYFDLILEDQIGNRSPNPSGDGSLSIRFSSSANQAVLSQLPSATTDINSTDIRVGGQNIITYKYQIDSKGYSAEIPVSESIKLTNLLEGTHELKVIGKNRSGIWQDEQTPTTYRWLIDFTAPILIISGPFPPNVLDSEFNGRDIVYKITYNNFAEVTLTPDDLFLNTSGDANGRLVLTREDDYTWNVTVTDISGSGQLRIGVLPGTATYNNGKTASGANSPFFSVLENRGLLDNLTEVVRKTPLDIIPSQPQSRPSAQELQQVAIGSLRDYALKVTGRNFFISVPRNAREVSTRIERCQLTYPGIDFLSQSVDVDGDGLSNRTECYALTNPSISDSDFDGCLDGEEVNFLGLNPLNGNDCPFANSQKIVSITSPQTDWILSKLEIMGLTPSDTNTVDLIVFPVRDGIPIDGEAINLGTVNAFNESSVKNHYFFEWTPDLLLRSGETYDLVAVSTLQNGEMLSSPPVRFTLDATKTIKPPIPTAIENQRIDHTLKLTNVQVWSNDDGRISVSGLSEYGAKVYVVWKSIVLASSVINDSDLGAFSILSPMPLESDQQHELTIFAVKDQNGQKIRSQNVQVDFFLHRLDFFSYLVIIILLRVVMLFIIYRLKKHYKKY